MITNNTVVNDELLRPLVEYQPAINIGDKTHEGSSSNGVQVYNNIANVVTVYNLNSIVAELTTWAWRPSARCFPGM